MVFSFLAATSNLHILVPCSAMRAFAAIISSSIIASSWSSRTVFKAVRRVTARREGDTDGVRTDCGGEVIKRATFEASDCGEAGGYCSGTSIIGSNGGGGGGGGGGT